MNTTLGWKEYVLVLSKRDGRWKRFEAKMDTGAGRCRIKEKEAKKLGLEPTNKTVSVITGSGKEIRSVAAKTSLLIAGRKFSCYFRISTKHPHQHCILIGRSILKQGFVVDVSKTYLWGSEDEVKKYQWNLNKE